MMSVAGQMKEEREGKKEKRRAASFVKAGLKKRRKKFINMEYIIMFNYSIRVLENDYQFYFE